MVTHVRPLIDTHDERDIRARIFLNYHESLLIYGHVSSSIRFIETIEMPKEQNKEEAFFDDISF